MESKIYSLLGFAARARKLAFGKERIRGYMKAEKGKKMVIVAKDASGRLRYDLRIRSEKTGTRLLVMFSKSELGKLVGKEEVSAFGVEDEKIIEGIEGYLSERG